MNLRICVIDDEESIRYTFKSHLEDLGHQVTTFENPEVMLHLSKSCGPETPSCFDVIFVDCNMPKVSGIEFLEHSASSSCKLDPARKYLMSGAFTDDMIDKASKMGSRILEKPISLEKLGEIVSQIAKEASACNS